MKVKFLAKLILRIFIYTLVGVILLGISTLFLMDRTFDADRLKRDLEKELSDFFQRPIQIEKLDWTLSPFLILSGTNVNLTEKDGTILAKSSEVHLTVDLLALLRKEIDVKKIHIIDPILVLKKKRNGTLNLTTLVRDIDRHRNTPSTSTASAYSTVIQLVKFDNATLKFIDEVQSEKPLPIFIKGDSQFDLGSSETKTFFKTDLVVRNRQRQSGSIVGQGEIGEGLRLKLSMAHMPLNVFEPYWPNLQKVTGHLNADMTLSDKNGQVFWRGTAKTSPVNIGTATVAPILDAQFDLNFSTPSFVGVNLYSDETQIQTKIQFQLPLSSSSAVQMEVKSDPCRIENIKDWWEGLTSSTSTETTTPTNSNSQSSGTVVMTLDLKNISYQNVAAKAFSTHLTLLPNHLTFENSHLELIKGNVDGRLDLDFDAASSSDSTSSTGPTPFFSLQWDADDIDLVPFHPYLPTEMIAYGAVSSSGSLSGVWDNKQLSKLNGGFVVVVSSGALAQIPGAIKVLNKLNVKTLFKTDPATKADMVPFDAVSANLAIHNGVMSTREPAVMKNSVLHLAFTGKIDMVTNSVDGVALLYFQTVVSEVVNAIPGVRAILLGDKKSLTPLTVKISGPRENPNFDIKPVKQVTKTVGNIFRNIFKIPENLFDSVLGSEKK